MGDAEPLMYGEMAGWFGLLTPPEEYADEAAEVRALLEEHVDGTLATALELGSGGGHLASHLGGRLGLVLTDVSPAMLAASRDLLPGVEHVLADMRTLRLGRTFDAVIAHDAIGYMTSEADLRAAMETAFVHLRPGGAAIFLPDWVRDTFVPVTEHGGSDDGGRGLRYLEWDRDLDPDSDIVRTDYIIVTREESDVVVHHDVHTLGIFPRATWLRLLEGVGFDALGRRRAEEGLEAFVGRRPTSAGS